MRLRRAVAAVLVTAGLTLSLLGSAAPASAAGTGGIEVTPLSGGDGLGAPTAFHVLVPDDGESTERFLLRNVTGDRVSGRLYAAAAVRDPDGSYTIGASGSSPYVELPEREITLAPGARQVLTFTVRRGPDPEAERHAAVVVAVSRGTIVERAATLVYLAPAGSGPAVVPLTLAVLAGGLVVAVGGTAAHTARRRRAERRA